MTITDKNHKPVKHDLRIFYASEIGRFINRAGSQENLSILLGKSKTYVRMILNREATTERLESLYEECKGAWK